MSKQETIERERRWALPVAIACGLVVALSIAGVVLAESLDIDPAAGDAETWPLLDDQAATFLASAIAGALASGLLAAPMLHLFRAAAARSERVRQSMVGIVVAGPLLAALGIVLNAVVIQDVAPDLVAGGGDLCPVEDSVEDQNDCVRELAQDSAAFPFAAGLGIAGGLGVIVSLLYTSLYAMRTGLLSRFWGSFGMALPIALIFLGPFGDALRVIFVLALALLFVDRWPGGRPPAWDAGEAIPWPRPGEEPPARPEGPADVEGSAEELPAEAAGAGANGEGSAPRRKRKRRR